MAGGCQTQPLKSPGPSSWLAELHGCCQVANRQDSVLRDLPAPLQDPKKGLGLWRGGAQGQVPSLG